MNGKVVNTKNRHLFTFWELNMAANLKKHLLKLTVTAFSIIFLQISVGCSLYNNHEAKAAWFSPSSDPNRKVQSALTLIPKNATPDDVRKILGTNCVFHYYGGSDTCPAHWFMEYPVAGGSISGGLITNGTVAIQFDNPINKNYDNTNFQYIYKCVYYITFQYSNGIFTRSKAN
jgi:hypothetical protein